MEDKIYVGWFSSNLHQKWDKFYSQITSFISMFIPRLINLIIFRIELRGFCYSSTQTYSAVVCLKTVDNITILVAAKPWIVEASNPDRQCMAGTVFNIAVIRAVESNTYFSPLCYFDGLLMDGIYSEAQLDLKTITDWKSTEFSIELIKFLAWHLCQIGITYPVNTIPWHCNSRHLSLTIRARWELMVRSNISPPRNKSY